MGDCSDADPLIEQVRVAMRYFGRAAAFHEAWHPAVYDPALLTRASNTGSKETFFSVRRALRRELLGQLLALWDGTQETPSLPLLVEAVAANASSVRFEEGPEAGQPLAASGAPLSGAGSDILGKYRDNGQGWAVLRRLRETRFLEELKGEIGATNSHTEVQSEVDDEIAGFFDDLKRLVEVVQSAFPDAAPPSSGRGTREFWASLRE